jgi:glycosyltransferase involved in cell wall biosynthesis
MMPRLPITVLIPTYNCAQTLGDTLRSACWVEEILVVDSYSTDGTLDICRQFGARVIRREYSTPAQQKNWAIPQCRHEWILQLDSDEMLEHGAYEQIAQAIQDAPAVDAFRLPRKNHVLGVWMRHGGIYPDYQTRLFRRSVARFADREVHEHICVPGQVGTLSGHILHYGMPTISKQLRNLDRYTRYEADELRKRGRRFRGYRLLLHPWLVFCYRYFWQQGFRDGWRGLVVCAYQAIYDFLAQAKLWEIEALKLERSPK